MLNKPASTEVAFQYSRNAAASFTTGGGTVIVWDGINYESHPGAFDSSDGLLYVPESGKYICDMNVIMATFTDTAGKSMRCWLEVNGTDTLFTQYGYLTSLEDSYKLIEMSGVLDLNAGDQIGIKFGGNGSVNYSTLAGTRENSSFSLFKVSE